MTHLDINLNRHLRDLEEVNDTLKKALLTIDTINDYEKKAHAECPIEDAIKVNEDQIRTVKAAVDRDIKRALREIKRQSVEESYFRSLSDSENLWFCTLSDCQQYQVHPRGIHPANCSCCTSGEQGLVRVYPN